MKKGLQDSAFTTEYGSDAILQSLLKSGTISVDDVADVMLKKKKEKIEKIHKYSITEPTKPAGRWSTYLPDDSKPNNRRKLVKPTEELLYDAILEYYDSTSQQQIVSLTSLYPEWIKYYASGVAEETVIRVNNIWKKYYQDAEIATMPLKELNKINLKIWLQTQIRNYDMDRKKYQNFALIIRQMLDYAVDLSLIEFSPMDQVKIDIRRLCRKSVKKPDETQVYTDAEVERLQLLAWEDFLSEKSPNRLSPLASIFMFLTGTRISEACAVKYSDLISDRQICIQRKYSHVTKRVREGTKGNHGARIVPLPKDAIQLIEIAQEYQQKNGLPTDGYIFSVNSDPLPYQSLTYRFKKYCTAMGIPVKSSHKARKSYISKLLDNKVNLNTVRQYVGHKDERTTLSCYYFDRSTEEEKLNQIDAIFS